MNRISAAAAILTAAATVAAAAAATIAPAMAATTHTAGGSAPQASSTSARSITRASTAAERARVTAKQAGDPSRVIAGESDGGKYVTVVTCSGGATPPPIRLAAPGTPLTTSGTGPPAGISAMLRKPNLYKTVYTCSVTVEEKTVPVKPNAKGAVRKTKCKLGSQGGSASGSGAGGAKTAACSKGVTLNTGFGGMAKQVAGHHPGH
jgi:hypothetical protein